MSEQIEGAKKTSLGTEDDVVAMRDDIKPQASKRRRQDDETADRKPRRNKRTQKYENEEEENSLVSDDEEDEDEDESDNDSTCCDCHAGGELYCCDYCPRSFHIQCIAPNERPRPNKTLWKCPSCSRNKNLESLYFKGVIPKWMVKAGSIPRAPRAANDDRTRRCSRGEAVPISSASQRGKSTATSKIHVSPECQAPALPDHFLEEMEANIEYHADSNVLEDLRDSVSYQVMRGRNECRLVYSAKMWEREVAQSQDPERKETYSDPVIDQADLTKYLHQVARDWPQHVGWPYDSTYALKLLHYAGYDRTRAFQLLLDPHFNFREICAPPQRAYLNKWTPGDQRGEIQSNPFPPPEIFRNSTSSQKSNARK